MYKLSLAVEEAPDSHCPLGGDSRPTHCPALPPSRPAAGRTHLRE